MQHQPPSPPPPPAPAPGLIKTPMTRVVPLIRLIITLNNRSLDPPGSYDYASTTRTIQMRVGCDAGFKFKIVGIRARLCACVYLVCFVYLFLCITWRLP